MDKDSSYIEEKKSNRTYVFEEQIAKEYGVDEAILIHYFQYCIGIHKKNRIHLYEGRYWTYDSISTLENLYPFWSYKKIRLIINRLIEKNVLITGNFNQYKYDHTRWFAFQDEQKFLLVYKSVDKYQNPVDKPVDNFFSKNTQKQHENVPKKTYVSKNSPESRRDGHVPKRADRCAQKGRPIPVLYINTEEERSFGSSVDSRSDSRFQTSHANRGSCRALSDIIEPRFTEGYIPPSSIRNKLYGMGLSDESIDKQILKLILYHAKNPQIILNEESCVLGWFRNYLKKKGSY